MNFHVHQVALTDSNSPVLTGYALQATESAKNVFGSSVYRLWGMAAATAFIDERFDSAVSWAFRRLKPYAYKADLFKYCLLHDLGGWCVDLGIRMLQSPVGIFSNSPAPELVVFRSTGPWDASWNCSLALVYAEAGNAAFRTAIDEVVANCRNEYYGINPLCPTMTPFGRSLAVHGIKSNLKIGMVVDVEGREFHRGYQLAPLGLIAGRKPTGSKAGDVSSIGIEGSNNYASMWRARQIYGPT